MVQQDTNTIEVGEEALVVDEDHKRHMDVDGVVVPIHLLKGRIEQVHVKEEVGNLDILEDDDEVVHREREVMHAEGVDSKDEVREGDNTQAEVEVA